MTSIDARWGTSTSSGFTSGPFLNIVYVYVPGGAFGSTSTTPAYGVAGAAAPANGFAEAKGLAPGIGAGAANGFATGAANGLAGATGAATAAPTIPAAAIGMAAGGCDTGACGTAADAISARSRWMRVDPI